MRDFRPFSLADAVKGGQDIAMNNYRMAALPDQMAAQQTQNRQRQQINEQQMLINDYNIIKTRIHGVTDQNSYDQLVKDAVDNGLFPEGTLPKTYDKTAKGMLNQMLGNVEGELKKITMTSGGPGGEPMSTDSLYQGGALVEQGNPYHKNTPKQRGKGSGDSGIKSADANGIYKRSAELLGGVFDENGNLLQLDPDTRPTVLKIAELGERKFLDAKTGGKPITHSEAAKQAAQELKLYNESGATEDRGNDPDGVRGLLAK